MKKIMLILLCLILGGCATTSNDQLYYDTAKAISRDATVSQTACFAAVAEIAKQGDNGVKISAIALAEKCKNDTIKLEAPKRNILGL